MGKKSRASIRRGVIGGVWAMAVVAGLLVAPTSAQAVVSVSVADAVAKILSDTNALRAAGGLAPLVESTAMDSVAQNWSAQMFANGALTHNPNYSTQIPGGWTGAAENIASGYTYTTVVEAWHQSAGHYANIMGNYNAIGIGYYELNGQRYFTQDFGLYATVPSPAAPGSAGSPTPTGRNSPTTSFVLAAYTDVLGRTPEVSDSGVQYWVGALSAGAPRVSIAGGFTSSDEYRLKMINLAYRDVLGRQADPGGLSWWLDQMRHGFVQPDDAHRSFLSAQEFYTRQGGGTDAGYVSALYTDILGRSPDAGGLAYWVSVLQGSGRESVINGLWFAPETLNVRVSQAFQDYLGRPASVAEQTYWSSVARSIGPSGMRTQLLATAEYWSRAAARFP